MRGTHLLNARVSCQRARETEKREGKKGGGEACSKDTERDIIDTEEVMMKTFTEKELEKGLHQLQTETHQDPLA